MEQMTITVKEMAKQLNISLPTAYELLKSDDFPKFYIGRKILIPVESLKEWLANQSNKK